MAIEEEAYERRHVATACEHDRNNHYLMVIGGNSAGRTYKLGDGVELGRSASAAIQLADSEASRVHARIRREGADIILEDLQSTNGTFVGAEKITTRVLKSGDRIHIGNSVLKYAVFDALEGQYHESLYDATVRDALTGALNRTVLHERLQSEVAFAKAHETAFSLLVLDIDFFKRINDTHGHPGGDEVLKTLAGLIASSIRSEDCFIRYGGEEFVIMTRVDAEGGYMFAERLRQTVQSHPFMASGATIRVTVSIGVATVPNVAIASGQALFDCADKALYAAKQGGRNRTQLFTSLDTPGSCEAREADTLCKTAA